MKVNITSEIGKLNGVILHTPGPEVENMIPENAERALYSDILNLRVATKEYQQLKGSLNRLTKTFEVRELFSDILGDESFKTSFIEKVCRNEDALDILDMLNDFSSDDLAKVLIEGVEMKKDTLTKYLNKDRYSLRPLHNFFFTRDASMSVLDRVLIGKMASRVRDRESMIMEAIFQNHPELKAETVNPAECNTCTNVTIEGGDLLVARDDAFLIGMGPRTTSQGIDHIIDIIKERKVKRHIFVQELPHTPESFIHLDMVFTFLDKDLCMVYEPVILEANRYLTIHMVVDNGKVTKIEREENLLTGLNKIGFDLKPVFCGGRKDRYLQDREQWHSGANFFAVAPGVVMGYERNVHTIEELVNNGYEYIKAKAFMNECSKLEIKGKSVIAIEGSELARGGGGCRCMTMPVNRDGVEF
jgi:arginine deiminase